LLEGFEGAIAGAASGIGTVLEFGEGGGVLAGRLPERVVLFYAIGVLLLVGPHLGFDAVEAAEYPLTADEVVKEAAGFGGGWVVALVILIDEELEVGEFLVGEEEGLGVETGFQGVHGRGGLACGRGGAGGFLGVAAVGLDLAEGGHISVVPGGDRPVGPSYLDDKLTVSGGRGWMGGSY